MTNDSLNSAKRLFVAAKIRTFLPATGNVLVDSLNGIQSPISEQNDLYCVANNLTINQLEAQIPVVLFVK